MKMFLSLAVCLSQILISAASFAQTDEIKIFINDTELKTDVAPVIINDRTMVPMRAIFEALNAEVIWDNDKRQATGIKGEYKIILTVDSDVVVINNTETKIDSPAVLQNDRTMVPLRVVATALNADVDWDGDTKTVTVTEKQIQKQYNDENTIVFFGDSITQGGAYAKYLVHYMSTRFPYTKINYCNAGISGTALPPQNSSRLQYDVLTENPDSVFIAFGANDISCEKYTENGKISNAAKKRIDVFGERLTDIVEILKKENIETVIATPVIYDEGKINGEDVNEEFEGRNEALRLLGEKAKEIAEKYDLKLVDLWQCTNNVTNETREKLYSDTVLIAADRVHPNDNGNFVMAYQCIKDMGLDNIVACVELDVNAKTINAENAEVELINCTRNSAEYVYKPKSLPFAVNSAYKSVKENICGIDIADINKEEIKIIGLEEGEYKVCANTNTLLRCTNEELQSGINIAECLNNPNQKKAMESYKILNTGCGIIQSMRSVLPTESGIGAKEYYKINYENNYQKVLDAKEKSPDDTDIQKVEKYAELEAQMKDYVVNSQQILIPQGYRIVIEKVK